MTRYLVHLLAHNWDRPYYRRSYLVTPCLNCHREKVSL